MQVSPPQTPGPRSFVPFAAARAAAGAARALSRASGRGGTTLPGRVLLTLNPSAMRQLGARRQGRTVLVSATNGKTTLTAMLAAICTGNGMPIVHNMAGANLRTGIATTLMSAPATESVALLETDEAALPSVALDLQPDVIVLANLFRDQLDRYGELEALAERWRGMLRSLDADQATIVYNADDPLIAELVNEYVVRVERAGGTPRLIAFGCDDADVAADGLPHAADSKFCRRCHGPLTYRHSFVGHLGDYACSTCGFARPAADVSARRVELDGLVGAHAGIDTPVGAVSTRIRIPGLYNVYNAIAATAAAVALGLDAPAITRGLDSFRAAFGRFERIPVPGGGSLTLLLVKNPIGLNEVVRTLTGAGVDLSATLFALNDGHADGRDTSWVWDADIEPLLEVVPGMVVTGDRAAEFALRATYGGLPADSIQLEEDIELALFALLERARSFTDHGHAYALVTYTAMLRMREVIRKQGWVSAYWLENKGGASGTATTLPAATGAADER